MIIQDRSFPHPVLAPFRDDVSPSAFTLALAVDSDADNYFLTTHIDYANPTLSSLIAEGRAQYCIHIECKRNFFRQTHTSAKPDARITLRTSDIVGRVEVNGFICAVDEIPQYRVLGSHADYGEASFDIGKGDVLAVAETVTFDAFVDYDPLARISSILTIRCSDTIVDGPVELDSNGDKIIATLSKSDYERYVDLKADPSVAPLLANQVVVPAIHEAIHEIKQTDSDELELEMNKRWFRAILKKLEELNIDVRHADSSAVAATQALLRLPLRRSLDGIVRITAEEGEE